MPRAAAARAHPLHARAPARPVENIDIARVFKEIADLLETMSRKNARRLVERHGGRTADRVTRATALVVAGGAGPGSKLQRARELTIPVVTEREFLRRYSPTGRGVMRRRRTRSISRANRA